MSANDVVVVSAVRTPFGKFDGVLKTVRSFDLAIPFCRKSPSGSISILRMWMKYITGPVFPPSMPS